MLLPGEEAASRKKRKEGPEVEVEEKKSQIQLPHVAPQLADQRLEDERRRMPLGATALPSVCCYTLFNTYSSLNNASLAHDGSRIAGCCADSSLRIWNLEVPTDSQNSKKQRHERRSITDNHSAILRGHSGSVYSASWSPDNAFLLSAGEDATARLWSESGDNLVVYRGHHYPIWDVAFSPLGYYFATASHDKTARLWATNHVTPVRMLAGHLSDVNTVTFHPNCNYVLTGSSDKTARMWEVSSGECVRILTGHSDSINTCAISPNGNLAATAGDDNTVLLWDLASARVLTRLTGHTKRIYSLDFSADGNLLASGSADATVRLWDVQKAQAASPMPEESPENPNLLKTLPTKSTPIFSVQFTPRNVLLVAGRFDLF